MAVKMRLLAVLLSAAFLAGCGSGSGTSTGADKEDTGAVGYQYWRGDIPNSYYVLNIYGERARKVSGKPFMVVKYDKVSLQITDCEFGLSEVSQEAVTNPSNLAAAPEPTLDASTIDYHTKLDIKSPVVLLAGWGSKSTIANGVQNFSFSRGSSPGGVGYNENWAFSYDSVSMWGGVRNIDTTYYLGNDSANNAFSLLKL